MAATGSGNPPSLKLNSRQSILKRFTSYVTNQVTPEPEHHEIYQVSRIYGATSTFPIDVLRAVDGWDASLNGVEDTDIAERVSRAFPNRPFYATPHAVIVHDPKMSLRQLFRRGYKRGPKNLMYYRKFNMVPPIFPFPVVFALAALTSLILLPILTPAVVVVLPLLLYIWWPIRAIRERSPIFFALPYVQLGEELASLSGMLRGFLKPIGLRQLIASLWHQFQTDSLFRNAVYLMTSTAVMSVLGFGFWFFVAHLYAPAVIGTASAVISISLLIQNLSYLGLDSGLVRFLPTSKEQSGAINAALLIVGAAAALATMAYTFLGLGTNLPFFAHHVLTQFILVGLMVVVVLNSLTDNIFIANRRAGYHTITYAVLATTKLILPIFLVALGSLGIFYSYVSASFVSLVLTFIFMRKAAGYRFFVRPNWGFIRTSLSYVRANYVAKLVSGLPSQIMPMLIVGHLGAADAANFAMAWTMANLLYVIPSATSNSLLAESSADESGHRRHVLHSAKLLALMLTPAIVIAVLVAPYLLELFGPNYSAHATLIFQLFALATIFTAINTIGGTVLNVAKRTKSLVGLQFVIAITNLALAIPLMRYGLVGVGIAYLVAQIVGNLALMTLLLIQHKHVRNAALIPDDELLAHFGTIYNLPNPWFSNDLGGGDRSATVIVTAGNDKYVLKVHHARKRSLEHTEQEVAFMEYLRSQDIPVPHIIYNSDGKLITTYRDEQGEWIGVLMSYVQGQHPKRFTKTLLTNMAELQAKIHEAGIKYMRLHADIKLATTKSSLLPLPKGLSHFDYDDSNLFVHNSQIVSVIDFEGMRADSLVACIGFTLTWLHEEDLSADELATYVSAYQRIRPLTWLERQALRWALALRRRSLRLLTLKF